MAGSEDVNEEVSNVVLLSCAARTYRAGMSDMPFQASSRVAMMGFVLVASF